MSCSVTLVTTAANTVVTIDEVDSPPAREARFEALFRAHYDRLVRALTVIAGDRPERSPVSFDQRGTR